MTHAWSARLVRTDLGGDANNARFHAANAATMCTMLAGWLGWAGWLLLIVGSAARPYDAASGLPSPAGQIASHPCGPAPFQKYSRASDDSARWRNRPAADQGSSLHPEPPSRGYVLVALFCEEYGHSRATGGANHRDPHSSILLSHRGVLVLVVVEVVDRYIFG